MLFILNCNNNNYYLLLLLMLLLSFILAPSVNSQLLTLSSSKSGLSMLTTAASSWSSRPSRVTVKLMRVHCACSSGWKWGFASFVWRMRWKAGLKSHSLSPILMYLKLEQKEHEHTSIPGHFTQRRMVVSVNGIYQHGTLHSSHRNHY